MIQAVDLLLNKMKEAGFPFGRVVGLSGSGQQHGSVYWREGAGKTLAQLQPSLSLHHQLQVRSPLPQNLTSQSLSWQESFSLDQSPVWMDSGTSQQCQQLEEAFGGPLPLAQVTGSRAYQVRVGEEGVPDVILSLKRFTGNQIAKIFQGQSNVESYKDFDKTEVCVADLLSVMHMSCDCCRGSHWSAVSWHLCSWVSMPVSTTVMVSQATTPAISQGCALGSRLWYEPAGHHNQEMVSQGIGGEHAVQFLAHFPLLSLHTLWV